MKVRAIIKARMHSDSRCTLRIGLSLDAHSHPTASQKVNTRKWKGVPKGTLFYFSKKFLVSFLSIQGARLVVPPRECLFRIMPQALRILRSTRGTRYFSHRLLNGLRETVQQPARCCTWNKLFY